MAKVSRKEISSTPFSFARQFTAPPFFVGLEDAKMKSQLLLGAVQTSGKKPAKIKPAKEKASKKGAARKLPAKSKGRK